MKTCPACNATYDDSVTFCAKDGTRLLDAGSKPSNGREGQMISDRYRVLKLLGEGGMGEVYLAEHTYLNKKVAIKLLRSEITSSNEAVQRFYQEAKSAARIKHESIIEIYDFGKLDDGTIYLAMEFLEGSPLADIMLNGPMELSRAIDIVIQIADGLAAAHAEGIIHRDMKPENVFIIRDRVGRERVKILDFGIAKMSSGEGEGHGLTKTGTIFGTPHYMSPEQAMGRQLDHRTDIYSLGVIMFKMFAGSVPFKAELFMGILTQHITTPPPAPTSLRPDLPPPVEQVILKAMDKDPSRRYQSMSELIMDLQRVMLELGISTPTAPPLQTLPPPQAVGVPSVPPGSSMASALVPPVPPSATGTYGTMTSPPATGPYVPAASATGMAMPAYQTQTPYSGQSATVSPVSEHSGKGALIAILVIVLLGGGGAAGWWFFLRNKKSNETQPTTTTTSQTADTTPSDMPVEPSMPESPMPVEPPMPESPMPVEPPMPESPMPTVETVSITLFTNIDALTPSPHIRVLPAGETMESPATLSIEKGSTIKVEITRDGYKSIEKEITANGPKRVKVSMERLTVSMEPSMAASMSMEPLFKPIMEPVMEPTMTNMGMNIEWD